MRLQTIVLCSLSLFAGALHINGTSGDPSVMQVSLEREPVDFIEPYYRAYATLGNAKMSFLVPQGFRLQGDASSGIITLGNRDGTCTMTFAVQGKGDSGEVNADTYREILAKQHPNGRIVKQFSAGVAGRSGPGFDLQWKATPEITQCKRVIYVPSKIGVLQFTATTGSTTFAAAEANLKEILSTFCYALDGKLKVSHLSGTS